ncbi:unnamed protein product [Adineta ricciae]|uniref:Uncharacterized protein n=1 Tax=Adineta ricciae TaxID=249248 RepID=A0A814W8R6_ADIRI|nr:unnamed protein product [Adineta ricciae]CAF1199135.1 unnamed protein product [Adineta ricciae]
MISLFSSHSYPGRSFRRLDPLKSEPVPVQLFSIPAQFSPIPASSLPPDSGRNCTANIRSVPGCLQLEVCRKRSRNDWNLRLNFRPEFGGKEMAGKRT